MTNHKKHQYKTMAGDMISIEKNKRSGNSKWVRVHEKQKQHDCLETYAPALATPSTGYIFTSQNLSIYIKQFYKQKSKVRYTVTKFNAFMY